MTDLQKLKAGLAEKLAAKQKAEFSVEAIEGQFAEELSKWLELNPEVKTLHEQLEKAKEEKKAADTAWKESRKEAATELGDYFEEKPEDKDKVPGLSYKRFKKPYWACAEENRINAIIKAGATFLLQVDEKAVETFVTKMAVENENKDAFIMPSPIRVWLPLLTVDVDIRPQISDKDLLK